MNTINTIDVSTIPGIEHDEAMDLQAAEYERALALLRSLEPADWSARTDCPDWDVRQMWLHVLGASEAGASMRENVHQMRLGRKHCKQSGGPLEAGLSAVQVAERVDLTPQQLVDRLGRIAPKTVAARRRMPRPLRAIKIGVDGPVVEKWSLGYLTDVIYLRDLWMHRVDTAAATGRDIELTAQHDCRIVADVVAEWARRHGKPFDLTLTGPAGGRYTVAGAGAACEAIELDAVAFCLELAGRSQGEGLMSTVVPF
jgi:uncharacterized protein (TIGR03083 family)